MKEAIVSKAYAKSIYLLGKENNIDIATELTTLSEVINTNNSLETVLFLDVFTPEEKQNVLNDIMAKIGLSNLCKNTLNFLLAEKRMGLFPMIFKEIIVLDDHEKGFLKGVIEGREDVPSEDFLTKIHAFLKEKLGAETTLSYIKNENITAGYKVTVEDLQLDASLDNQLNQFKNNVLNS